LSRNQSRTDRSTLDGPTDMDSGGGIQMCRFHPIHHHFYGFSW